MIPFNIPPYVGGEEKYIAEAIEKRKICGDGEFTRRASELLESMTGAKKALLTTSCTSALEMSAILCGIKAGDEVIMPSYTFVSTANAYVLRGARIVFCDIRPDTLNIDENRIEEAITDKTRAIVAMHYAGVCCDMDKINAIADKHGLSVIEDAAQAVTSLYKGRPAGMLGDFGCYSFHETKNFSMGEGGALLLRREDDVDMAEIIREKGTDRSRFYRGQVDKYTWVSMGSSFLPSELNAAYLLRQLECRDMIQASRMARWEQYMRELKGLRDAGVLELPTVPGDCAHNAHMFYIKAKDISERTRLIAFLKDRGVNAVFHYIPLHSAKAGLMYGRFSGEDVYTTRESERLLRLPLYYGMTEADCASVIDAVREFYR